MNLDGGKRNVPAGWLRKAWSLDVPADAAAPDMFSFYSSSPKSEGKVEST